MGNISDFSSIRFIRMFLTGFEKPIILRFGSFDLVRGEWREYEQNIDNAPAQTGKLAVSAVNIEETKHPLTTPCRRAFSANKTPHSRN